MAIGIVPKQRPSRTQIFPASVLIRKSRIWTRILVIAVVCVIITVARCLLWMKRLVPLEKRGLGRVPLLIGFFISSLYIFAVPLG